MFRIFTDGDGGLFGVAMGSGKVDQRECDVEAIAAMQDAELSFERIMDQAARTDFGDDDLHIRLALSAIIGAWQCRARARTAAGS